jgi:hypothetical protein
MAKDPDPFVPVSCERRHCLGQRTGRLLRVERREEHDEERQLEGTEHRDESHEAAPGPDASTSDPQCRRRIEHGQHSERPSEWGDARQADEV